MLKIIIILLLLCPGFVLADTFKNGTQYQVCFTPDQKCTDQIVSAIDNARQSILVQAYSFTSAPIAHALVTAHRKGIEVKVILDKSQYRPRGFSVVKFLQDYRVPVFIDYRPNIAHNKIMIIDERTVITGSFNFTRAAQEKNTENVLLISDPELAKKYSDNWQSRVIKSKELRNDSNLFDS